MDLKPKRNAMVKYLLDLKDDRGALANLRRGLGKEPGTVPETYPFVVPFTQGLDDYQSKPFYLVASLFASHPNNSDQGNMGRTMAHVKNKQQESESIEKRFVALLNAHSEDLPGRLRQAVALAKSKDVPVNWDQLLKDVRYWNQESRKVQLAWAREFWAGMPQKETEEKDNPDNIGNEEQ